LGDIGLIVRSIRPLITDLSEQLAVMEARIEALEAPEA